MIFRSNDKEFGGELLNNRRKTKRPLDPQKATHFILRLKQNVPNFFSPHNKKVRYGILELAGKYNIRLLS